MYISTIPRSKLAALAIIGIIALCFQTTFAQEKSSNCRVSFAYFPGKGGINTYQLFVSESKSIEIQVWPGRLSPEVEIPVLDVWRIGDWETNPATGENVFKEIGRVKPKAAGRQWVLMFAEDKKHGDQVSFNCISVPLSEAGMRENSIYALNLTGKPIGAVIDGRQRRFDPKKAVVVNPDTKRGDDYPVSFLYNDGKKWRPFVETVWFHGQNRRRFAVFLAPSKDARPKLLKLEDMGPE